MNNDDVIYRHRLRILALAGECGSVAMACRLAGIHRSTFYRWQHMAERFGLEILRPRERRSPQMPNSAIRARRRLRVPNPWRARTRHTPAGETAKPPQSGRASSAEMRRGPRPGWPRLKARMRCSISTGIGYAAPPEPQHVEPAEERHLDVSHPGELVQMDAFCIGRLAGTKGVVWQYTAIDAASSFCWAELHVTPRNPDVRFASALAKRVAGELAACGWRLERVTTDNGSEFRNHAFDEALRRLEARHTLIYPGRPQSNGCVERVQRTILEECWKPAFARYLIPKYMGLRRELERYLAYYNFDRAHTGRLTQGRTPAEVLGAAKMYR